MRIVLLASLPPLPFLARRRARIFFRSGGLGEFQSNVDPDAAGITVAGIVVKFMSPRTSLEFLHTGRWRNAGRSEPEEQARRSRLQAFAESLGRSCGSMRTHYTTDFHSRRTLRAIRAMAPDLCIYLGGKDLIRPALLEIPPMGVIGNHFALLPRLRGMHVTEWAVLLGEPVGVAVQRLEKGVDTGEIILQEPIVATPADTIESLRERSRTLSRQLLLEAIALLATGNATFLPQQREEGRQYYRMHDRLRSLAEIRLRLNAVASSYEGSSAE
ncbi:MAG TPA: formyltransferase family protein [Candidatus Kapabacteria bacterium]|nr:formyltransferase family protein [Candidatus Kapabacteria bacterium]